MSGPGQEIVIAGDPALDSVREMVRVVRLNFLPNKVVLMRRDGPEGNRLGNLVPFVREMRPRDGKASAYVCQRYSCRAPVTDPGKLEHLLKQGKEEP